MTDPETKTQQPITSRQYDRMAFVLVTLIVLVAIITLAVRDSISGALVVLAFYIVYGIVFLLATRALRRRKAERSKQP